MIPDVTPNGVFYLPPTGWLTSFYNPPTNIFPAPVKNPNCNFQFYENCNNGLDKITLTGEVQDIFKD